MYSTGARTATRDQPAAARATGAAKQGSGQRWETSVFVLTKSVPAACTRLANKCVSLRRLAIDSISMTRYIGTLRAT